MKPVIKKQTHYSLMLMRDDGDVRSCRIRNTTVRFFIIIFTIILLVGSAGIGIGVHYWKRYAAFLPELTAARQELAETRTELAELRNLQAVVRARNGGRVPLLAQNTEVGVAAPESSARTAGMNGRSGSENAAASPAGDDSATPVAENTSDLPQTQPPNGDTPAGTDAANADEPQSPPPTGPTGQNGASGTNGQDAAGADAGHLAISNEASPVRVSALSMRASGQQSVTLRYELSVSPEIMDTPEGRQPVVGRASYKAIMADGKEVALQLQSQSNAFFSILRMKPMTASVRLPDAYTADNIAQIAVVIAVNGGNTFQENYPFTQQ